MTVPSSHAPRLASSLFVGIDLGTSGCRAIAIDAEVREVASAQTALPEPLQEGPAVEQDPMLWREAVTEVLEALLSGIDRSRVAALAVDGTSGTVLVTDAKGRPLHPALMYNDNRAVAEAETVARTAPRQSAAHGTGAGLPKLLWLLAHYPDAARAHTQADWIATWLGTQPGVSDANNVLKLGWDPLARRWPDWLSSLGVRPELLPTVVEPGTQLGPIGAETARHFGLGPHVRLVAGTTDSTAAILAAGATEPGDAITSLGSTLVMKVVSKQPVFAPEYGIYSQPLGRHWLVGGGSNSGGAVLRRFFNPERLLELSPRIDPERPSGLDYYPLPAPGERFPFNDPRLAPRMAPRPSDDARFLHGLLEGMARIEAAAYRRLTELGAPPPRRVFSTGGGATNPTWSALRAHALGVPVEMAAHQDAAYGSALLARSGMLGPEKTFRNEP